MKKVIKLLEYKTNKFIIIGTDSIIVAKTRLVNVHDHLPNGFKIEITEIQSRAAMATTHYVYESVETIYNLINN